MNMHVEKMDVVRGTAILLVLFYHSMLIVFPGYELRNYDPDRGLLQINSYKELLLNMNPFGQGWIGVSLFLVISGFLIHLIYLRNGSVFQFRNFYSKRFWRIYPPYLLALLFFAGLTAAQSGTGFKDILFHLFMAHNLSDTTYFTINPSFWSIALECQLYLMYPLFLFIVRKFGTKKALWLTVAIGAGTLAGGSLLQIQSHAFYSSVLSCWPVWCSGAYLADKFHHNKKLFKRPKTVFIISMLLFFSLKMFEFAKTLHGLAGIISCLAFTEMVLYSAFIDRNPIAHSISKAISGMGIISYSIYLIHQPYLGNIIEFFSVHTTSHYFNLAIGTGMAWLIILLLSYALYHLVEQRSIAIGKAIRRKSDLRGLRPTGFKTSGV